MCGHCGCSEGNRVTITGLTGLGPERERGRSRHEHRDHDHHYPYEHVHAESVSIELGQAILAKNDRLAAANRDWFSERSITALNLVSSPGAGKTTLLERTIRDLGAELEISVIEGDQETLHDAERIRATGVKAVQINTGTGCHLEADMLARGLDMLAPSPGSLVMIENVGNMVCPSMFDLGEHAKVAILSITEGEDKPIKYPHMIRAASVLLLNKIDLLRHVDFDAARCIDLARQVNPDLQIFRTSATTGEGLNDWYAWLQNAVVQSGVLHAIGSRNTP